MFINIRLDLRGLSCLFLSENVGRKFAQTKKCRGTTESITKIISTKIRLQRSLLRDLTSSMTEVRLATLRPAILL